MLGERAKWPLAPPALQAPPPPPPPPPRRCRRGFRPSPVGRAGFISKVLEWEDILCLEDGVAARTRVVIVCSSAASKPSTRQKGEGKKSSRIRRASQGNNKMKLENKVFQQCRTLG
ncbi:Protein of unknown function [Gryllus bimaculatus]|nr:Protein of unknown function [Gryllus bimaculatus]